MLKFQFFFMHATYMYWLSCDYNINSNKLSRSVRIFFKSGMAGCGRAPGFLKLFSEKCVCVCLYVYLFVFPRPREQTFYLKLESSLYAITKRLKKAYITLKHR